jgi:hypothetical protein
LVECALLWVMFFDIVEVFICIFVKTPALMEAFVQLKNHLTNVWLGGALLIFFSFIPFFAFKELVNVVGKEKIRELFLRRHLE